MERPEPIDEKQQIAARLIALREAFGWSATYVAQACGVSPQRWYTYEKARSEPAREVLQKLKLLTGVTSDYILFGDQTALTLDLAVRLGLVRAVSNDKTA